MGIEYSKEFLRIAYVGTEKMQCSISRPFFFREIPALLSLPYGFVSWPKLFGPMVFWAVLLKGFLYFNG